MQATPTLIQLVPMPSLLTATETEMFRGIPEEDLVELAAELDIAVPETIHLEELLGESIVAMAQRARREGLPFSEYDRDDLGQLPRDHLVALASLCGVDASVDALLKAGAKVYRTYRRQRPRSQVPMLLPMLLPALARYASDTE